MFNKITEKKCLLAFLISLLLGCIIVIPYIIIGKGILTIWADFNTQQIPFGIIMNDSLKSGEYLWTWYNELGSNFIGTFSFYNLFSPFYLITYLFPARWFPYVNSWMLILKFGIAGLSSYLFLSRYVKNKNYAVIGSVLYSFSGFQLTNIMFPFYDIVCLFPFLLYETDKFMYEDKKLLLPLTVFLMAITNWFMFFGQCVFVSLYVFVKLIFKEYRFDIKRLFKYGVFFLLGILLACFVLLPSYYFVIENPRIDSTWSLFQMISYGNITAYVEIFRALFFPHELMHVRAFLTDSNFCSIEFYLPFVGMIFIVSYIIKNWKKWDSFFMLLLFVFMFIPILNSSFFGFKANYYARWFYMATLIGSLLTIKCLDEKIKITKGVIVSFIAIIVMIFLYVFLKVFYVGRNFVFNKTYLILVLLFSIINIVVNYLIFRNRMTYKKYIEFVICIVIYVSFWGIYTIYCYRENGFKYDSDYNDYLNIYKEVQFDDIVRSNNNYSCNTNLGYIIKNANVRVFNSNINGSVFNFYNSIDYSRIVTTDLDDDRLNDFLSVKYYISCGEDYVNPNYELIKSGDVSVYENRNYREMGLVFNNYISNDEFNNLSLDEKYNTLLNSIILNEDQIDRYYSLFDKDVSILINNFKYDKNGFRDEIEVTGDTLVLYTVAYDKGWNAYNDGNEIPIEKVDNGFMAIKVNKGINNIEFKYKVPGLKEGLIISFISFGIYAFFVIIFFIRKRLINN